MNRRSTAILAIALLLPLAGCESNGGGSASVGVYGSYGYYSGYYPGYGYWYDDDDAVVIRPPEDRPERPTTLPSQLPAERPSASTRPSTTSTRSNSSSMSRPASRPMPSSRRR
jgi:hypothetical protein